MMTGRFILIATFILACSFGCNKKRKDVHYIIPEDYSGWAVIVFGIDGEEPIESENASARTVEFDDDGVVFTSSTLSTGIGSDRFFKRMHSGALVEGAASDFGGLEGFESGTYLSTSLDREIVYFAFYVGTLHNEERSAADRAEEIIKRKKEQKSTKR